MSKKNYTMSLETKTVDGIKTYAKDNERSVSWVCNKLLKDGIRGVEDNDKWMHIAHGYEYANTCLKGELLEYKNNINKFNEELLKIGIDNIEGDISGLIEKFSFENLEIFKKWSYDE